MTVTEILRREAQLLGCPVHKVFHAASSGATFVVYDVEPLRLSGVIQTQRRWVVCNDHSEITQSGIIYCNTEKEKERA